MKPYLLSFILCFVAAFSCTKDELNGTLSDTWRMVLVTDNATGVATTKPDSINGEITVTFQATGLTTGTFTGKTTRNDFFGNFTAVEENALSVEELNMTKISETSWGDDFIDNFRAAQSYSFESIDKLRIKSAEKTLTFQKE